MRRLYSARVNNNSNSAGHETVDIGRLLDDNALSRYQVSVVALAAFAVMFDGADIQLLGIAIPALIKEWGVTRADFVSINTFGLIGMTIGTSLGGIVGDRVGRRGALIGSVL